MQKLENRIALVTGGNSGIGLATAARLAQHGARVFVAGRREAELAQAVAGIDGHVEALRCDVTRADELDRLFETIRERAGALDILVASSGVAEPAPLDEMNEAHFDRLFGVNVRGLAFTVQRAARLMTRGGAIVLVGSIAGSVGNAGYGTYSASKAAVRSFARTWAKELAARDIRVNTLSPGPTDTPMFDGVSEAFRQQVTALIPMQRLGLPDEIADAALFLASPDSAYVNGAELVIDGGMIA